MINKATVRRVLGDKKHPGLPESASLRGAAQEGGSWSVQESERCPAFRKTPNRRPWGARGAIEEGSLHPPRHAASHARGDGKILHSGCLGSRVVLSSFQPVVAASEGWVGALPASGVSKGDDLRGLDLAACLQRRVAGSVDFRVTHCPRPSKEGCVCHGASSKEGVREARGEHAKNAHFLSGDFVCGEDWSLVGCARAS